MVHSTLLKAAGREEEEAAAVSGACLASLRMIIGMHLPAQVRSSQQVLDDCFHHCNIYTVPDELVLALSRHIWWPNEVLFAMQTIEAKYPQQLGGCKVPQSQRSKDLDRVGESFTELWRWR